MRGELPLPHDSENTREPEEHLKEPWMREPYTRDPYWPDPYAGTR